MRGEVRGLESVVGDFESFSQLTGDLIKGLLAPITEPIDNTAVKNGGRAGRTVREIRTGWVHGKDHVQISLDIPRKVEIDLLVRLKTLVRLVLTITVNK